MRNDFKLTSHNQNQLSKQKLTFELASHNEERIQNELHIENQFKKKVTQKTFDFRMTFQVTSQNMNQFKERHTKISDLKMVSYNEE